MVLDFDNASGKVKIDEQYISVYLGTHSNFQYINLYDKKNQYSENGFLAMYETTFFMRKLTLLDTETGKKIYLVRQETNN